MGPTDRLTLVLVPQGGTANALAPEVVEGTERFGGDEPCGGSGQPQPRDPPLAAQAAREEIAAAIRCLVLPEAASGNGGWGVRSLRAGRSAGNPVWARPRRFR